MSGTYPVPVNFITVTGNLASQAVLAKLSAASQSPIFDRPCRFIVHNDAALLVESLRQDIKPELTVALFDVTSGNKCFTPNYLTQKYSHRPVWASKPLWSVAIHSRHFENSRVIRQCAQEIAAWFSRGIKHAVPGHSYPWGPVPVNERNVARLHIAQQQH
jgi:hypothetical protein